MSERNSPGRRHRSANRWRGGWLFAGVAAAALSVCSDPAAAQNQGSRPASRDSYLTLFDVELPAPRSAPGSPPATVAGAGPMRFSARSDLNVRVTTESGGNFGYVTILVDVNAATAATADRQLRFEFSAGDFDDRGREINVQQQFTMPAGVTTASYRMLAPRYGTWRFGHWSTWVDGRNDEQLSVEAIGFQQMPGGRQCFVLSIDTVRLGQPLLQRLESIGALNGQVIEAVAPAAELPLNWLQWTPYDVAVIDSVGLTKLAEQHPQRLAALRRWTSSGGNLWVVDAGDEWDSLPAVDEALGLSATRPQDESPGSQPAGQTPPGWQPMPLLSQGDGDPQWAIMLNAPLPAEAISQSESPPDAAIRPDERLPQRPREPLPRSTNAILVRSLGMGIVVAFDQQLAGGLVGRRDGTRLSVSDLLTRSAAAARISAESRLGFAPDQAAFDFDNWRIPGVGLAPVTAFEVLITLFVILVGPVNYWLLARRRRLPLLLVTAPLAALAAVVLLFTYGLLTDGVGARVRARSVTILDQQRGEAAVWARLSYYAGMAPAGGLSMPDDVAVYPILPSWGDGRFRRGARPRRDIHWVDDQQNLVRGWLPARTPVQLLTIASRETSRRLAVREGEQGVQVENHLGVEVVALGLQDSQGRLYWTEQLADEAVVRLTPVPWPTVGSALRTSISDNELAYPVGAAPDRRNRWHYGGYAGTLESNLLEAQLRAITAPMTRELGDRSYVAITRRGVEVALGRPEGEIAEEASFHVVRGSW